MSRVDLHLYDLTQGMARVLSPALLGKQIEGVWHTGVSVFDIEYYYGGGIVAAPSGKAITHMTFKTIHLGTTGKSKAELESFLRTIAHKYTQATYQLLRHNCNNFSDEISRFLLGSGIPKFILDLPGEVMGTPIGTMLEGFESQLRNRTAGNSPLNPFGTAGAPALEPQAAAQASNYRQIPAPKEAAASAEFLRLAVEKLGDSEISNFFGNPEWRKISPNFQIFKKVLGYPDTLQVACILRHLFLAEKIPCDFTSLQPWLFEKLENLEISDLERLMLLTACVNFLAHEGKDFPQIFEPCAHFALHALSCTHQGSRRAAGRLLFNLFRITSGDSDIFVLSLTTLLTALGEEADAGTLAELLHATGAALAASRSAGLIVSDVLGEKISENCVRQELRGDKAVKEAIAGVSSYF